MPRLVRINAPDTPHFADDVAFVTELGVDGILLPKATPDAVQAVASLGLPVIALVESGDGLRHAYDTARHDVVRRMLLAPGDLCKDLRIERSGGDEPLLYARSKLVVDCAAAGIPAPIDYPSVSELDRFEEECGYARRLGYRGKLCVKLEQIEVVNRIFG